MSWFKKIMAGRYGTDQLSMVLIALALVMMIIALPFDWIIIKLLPLVPIVLSYYRIFSKQIGRAHV